MGNPIHGITYYQIKKHLELARLLPLALAFSLLGPVYEVY
jgi:hypothetical protein